MDLFHFTSQHGACGIVASGTIRKGSLATMSRVVCRDAMVSLTSEPFPDGLGLPNGQELTKEQADNLIAKGGNVLQDIHSKKLYTVDHTKFRLRIFCEEIPVISYKDFYRDDPLLLHSLAIASHFTAGDFDAPSNLQRLKMLAKDHKLSERIASTCYYAAIEIPIHHVIAIGTRDKNNQYCEISVKDFRKLVHEEEKARFLPAQKG